jgi:hypothetical protein
MTKKIKNTEDLKPYDLSNVHKFLKISTISFKTRNGFNDNYSLSGNVSSKYGNKSYSCYSKEDISKKFNNTLG